MTSILQNTYYMPDTVNRLDTLLHLIPQDVYGMGTVKKTHYTNEEFQTHSPNYNAKTEG